ncbi:hypothetical protein Q31b_41870 [Novipirellula aureliae]|uniref:Uncharacterized protein n=1 Tax=Novipirellula aureliae TaxID=2527966 RepID=A0A5C6DSE0_9BACT|nr:hypothetical protein [Novipirellula aureliae]TWU39104.1 hypothetical protein Q31b_41870 [Novipirellula aureliae]
MNVQPNAASASIAGSIRASARGGDAESQTADSVAKQATKETPAGKSGETSAIDAGEQTSDRDADGRQMYDTFESSAEAEQAETDDDSSDNQPSNDLYQNREADSQSHLDFDA